jgi:hypothetical protein
LHPIRDTGKRLRHEHPQWIVFRQSEETAGPRETIAVRTPWSAARAMITLLARINPTVSGISASLITRGPALFDRADSARLLT